MQTIPKGFDAANAPNNEEIEKQFAVAFMDHAEAYLKLLTGVSPRTLRLTKYDNRLVDPFLEHFPEYDDNGWERRQVSDIAVAIKEPYR